MEQKATKYNKNAQCNKIQQYTIQQNTPWNKIQQNPQLKCNNNTQWKKIQQIRQKGTM